MVSPSIPQSHQKNNSTVKVLPPVPVYAEGTTLDYGLVMYRRAISDAIVAILNDLPTQAQCQILLEVQARITTK